MFRKLLICGLVAGACGGALATGFATVAGEPSIDRAIAYEHGRVLRAAKAVGMQHGVVFPDLVPRSVQKSAGLLTAALVYGLALGGVFALVFAVAYGRVARAGPRPTAYGLAAVAFVVVYLVPFLKYPASPPGTTNPDTVGRRTLLYVTMIAISVLAAVAAGRLRPRLETRFGSHAGKLWTGLVFLIVVIGAGVALPSINEVPPDFPAQTLWQFREASVGTQAVLWLTIGIVFAWAVERVMNGQPILARRTARGIATAGSRK
jgi:uncharacterized membrane protein YidH (DUF202 family)